MITKEILEAFDFRNNVLVHRDSGKKVKRPRLGYVAFKGKLWRSREIIAIILQQRIDLRVSAGMEMARSFPDLKLQKNEAVSFGYSVYRTGRKCKKGHASWRYVSNGACLECCGKLRP